jgi:OmpR family response regulator RpaB
LTDGIDALKIINNEDINFIILDIILPKLDGYEVCRKIRADSQVPIIIVTALGKISNRIAGLESGADHYIIKPFAPKELDARINLALRKTEVQLEKLSFKRPNINKIGPLILNMNKRQVVKNGTIINITSVEFSLLELLIEKD